MFFFININDMLIDYCNIISMVSVDNVYWLLKMFFVLIELYWYEFVEMVNVYCDEC